MTTIKNINFPASKISTIIGKNPFNKLEDVFEEMKCRITGDKYKTLNDTNSFNKQELKKLSQELIPDIKISDKDLNLETILKQSCKNAVNCNNTLESHQIERDINKKIINILPDKDIKDIKEFINTNINTKRGIKNEDVIIQNYNKIHNTLITDNNEKLFIYPLIEINKNNVLYKFNISAKIDGINNGMLIEIKNRRNKLFDKIPEYEKVQLEIYLRILQLPIGKLVENHNNDIKEHIYNSNDKLWTYILDKLYSFSHQLLEDI
jgi:succinate dehydrogenase flavin-adding protein (antitoxin of CptAB toxin-antitoxin module)